MSNTGEPTEPPSRRRRRLRRKELPAYFLEQHGLVVAEATATKYAVTGGGPAFHKFGRTVVYDAEELDRWAIKKLGEPVRSTSERRGA